MAELDFESSQLQLVTDALRAGPGSPQWREALVALEHTPGSDEYKLLYTARERLASGREYREVRAGAGFTRHVLDAIEREESATPAKLPSASWIAGVSALVILGIVATVAWMVMPRGEAVVAEDLSQTYFVNTRSGTKFDGELGMEWGAFGSLAISADAGLKPVLKSLDKTVFRGGGVIYERTFASDQPFAVEMSVKLPKASDDLVVQVFIADDRNFGEESATSPHELVFSLRGGDGSVVLPDGTVATTSGKVPTATPIGVKVSVNRTQGMVEVEGKRVWIGKNQLDPTRPRIAGVRFLARGTPAYRDAPVVESVRVLTPQKP